MLTVANPLRFIAGALSDGWFWIPRQISKIPWITPNKLTLFRFVILLPLTVALFMNGMFLVGALVMCIMYLLDSYDGGVSRAREEKQDKTKLKFRELFTAAGRETFWRLMDVRAGSDFGADFDAAVDKITYIAVFIAIVLGGGFNGWNEWFSALTVTLMTISMGMALVLQGLRVLKAELIEQYADKAVQHFSNRSGGFGKAKVWAEWFSFLFVCATQIWGVQERFMVGGLVSALVSLGLACGSFMAHAKGVQAFYEDR